MSYAELYWREELWLSAIFLPLLLIALNRWWQRRQLIHFADASLIPWLKVSSESRRDRWPMFCLLLTWLFLCVAVAGPRFIQQLPPDYHPESSRLVVVVDLSASMNARDSRPDRRNAAQQLLEQWLPQKPSSLAVTVLLYAGHVFELMPVTTDEIVISHFIDSLTDIYLPTAGNDLSAALKQARESLLLTPYHRRLLILTDGDIELTEQQKVSSIFNDEWAALDVQTDIIGMGQSKPVTVPNRLKGLVEDQGRPVLSRLESEWLKQLSINPSIKYHHYQQAARQDINAILKLPALRVNADTQQQVVWQQWFQLPLLLGIFFLLMSVFLNNRNTQQVSSISLVLMLIMLLSYNVAESVAYASDRDVLKQAQQLLKQKQYRQAQQLFSQLDSMESYFGEGTACYRSKDYLCAQQAFSAAAWVASDDMKRARAVFNLANSYFFLSDYDQAVVLYRDAELLGIGSDLIANNLSYAQSMQASIQRELKYIQHQFKKALWKAAADGDPAPSLSDFLSINDSLLSVDKMENFQQLQYLAATVSIQQEIIRQLGLTKQLGQQITARWIETDRVLPQSTAKVMNRLFEMELGIASSLTQPQTVEGKRKW